MLGALRWVLGLLLELLWLFQGGCEGYFGFGKVGVRDVVGDLRWV
jgi:hypothetical protein